jgi:hypothetical protein
MTKRFENKTGQAIDPSQKTGHGSDPTSYEVAPHSENPIKVDFYR